MKEVERHLDHRSRFGRPLSGFADMRVNGAVAGMMVEPEASESGQTMGLWMLARSGETVRLVNDETFHPKAW